MSLEKLEFPEIQLQCKFPTLGLTMTQYEQGVYNLLQKILPQKTLQDRKELRHFVNEQIPYVYCYFERENTLTLSISLLCHQKLHVKNYFYDMVSRWLVPNKRLNIDVFFVADFTWPELGEQSYTVAQAVVQIADLQQLAEIEKNCKNVETEIRLGVVSDYHANKILEFKGLSSDHKTAMIQEKIGSLMRSRSKDFGQGIFSDMQYFLVTCREEFKTSRDYHHISRIISVMYVVRRLLKQKILASPAHRHLSVKFLKTRLQKNGDSRSVLGVLVGLNFLKDHEVCGKTHLLKALQQYIPGIKEVEDSFFIDRKNKESLQLMYLEVEKENRGEFSLQEVQKLRELLPIYLKSHIEQLIHPIFMPRNEEEVVRNIMTLSHQLKYVHDIPQVILSFDKQTASELSFTVILLRVLRPLDPALKDILEKIPTKYKCVFERVKRVGYLRRKYIKEANVFHVHVPAKHFLREDHSIDLNRARQEVLKEIERLFGNVRDYNGGMIFKQNQVYKALSDSLGSLGRQNELLLEKFFYSISPVEMTVIRREQPLKELFLLLLQLIEKKQETKKIAKPLIKEGEGALFIVISLKDFSKKKKWQDRIDRIKFDSTELLTFHHHALELSYLGYACFSEDVEKRKQLVTALE